MIKFNRRAWIFSVRVGRLRGRGIDARLIPAALALEAASGADVGAEPGAVTPEEGQAILRDAIRRRAARRLRPPPRPLTVRARGGCHGMSRSLLAGP